MFTARAFRKLLSVYVLSYFSFGFEGRIWDLTVLVPDHCLSFYFDHMPSESSQAGKKAMADILTSICNKILKTGE